MFRLNAPLPDRVECGGVFYDVDTSFDNILDVYDVIAAHRTDDDDIDAVGVLSALTLLIGPVAAEMGEAQQRAVFVAAMDLVTPDASSGGQPTDLNGDPMPVAGSSKATPFLFDQDAEYIWTGFMQAYHIDLHEQFGRLDWRKFLALFRDLPDDTKIKQIIAIRQWQPRKDDSAERRREMRDQQEIFALDEDEE